PEAYLNELTTESIIFKKVEPLNPVIKAGRLLIELKKFYPADFEKERDFFVMINCSKDSLRMLTHIRSLLGVKEIAPGTSDNWRPLQYHTIECKTGDKPLMLLPGSMMLISMQMSAGNLEGTMRLRMAVCTGNTRN